MAGHFSQAYPHRRDRHGTQPLLSFPEDNAVLQLIAAEKPAIFAGIKYAYNAMLCSTPFLACSMLFSLLYIFFVRPRRIASLAELPPYPLAAEGEQPFLLVGELHHPKPSQPMKQARWLTIPDRGLYTGIAILEATGAASSPSSAPRLWKASPFSYPSSMTIDR